MKTFFFTGGGTLGPVTPLLAVYRELVGARLIAPLRAVWVGTKDGPEHEKLKLFPEVHFVHLPIVKLDRFFSLRLFLFPFLFIFAFVKSLFILARYKPSVIVGAGAFTQVSLMWAGWALGIPSLIHQQDVRVGLANRLCAWTASRITVNFETTAEQFPKERTVVVGNPVFIPPVCHPQVSSSTAIEDPENKKSKDLNSFCFDVGFLDSRSKPGMTDGKKPLLIVIGGGTGSEQLNRLVALTAAELAKTFNIVLISGGRSIVGRGAINRAPTNGLVVTPFVQDTYHLLERADLVVTRAGMGTLTELASLGKPTIIIPIPHSHQEANARYFADHGAAEVFSVDYGEVEKRAGEFVALVRDLWDNEVEKGQLAKNIKMLYTGDATRAITQEIIFLLNQT